MNSVLNFDGKKIYMICSHLYIYMNKIRYIFNKTVNLTQVFYPTCIIALYKLGSFDDEILYKLQLVQTDCTSCFFLCDLQLVQNLNLYITYTFLHK